MWNYIYTDELYHHGIKGQKWGVRRSEKQLARARGKDYDAHDDYKKVHDGKKVKYLSDQELKDRNARLSAEKQYENMTKKTSTGKKVVNGIIAAGATVGGLTAAYLAFKKAGKTAFTDGSAVLNKIGDAVVNNIDLGGEWVG